MAIKEYKINNDEYDVLYKAHNNLIQIFELEELHDQLVESLLEFKAQLYSNALNNISHMNASRVEHHKTRGKLNRYIFNTLNIGKLYLDKNYHEGKNKCFAFDLTNQISDKNQMRELRETLYDSNLYYRLGCEMRKKAQHSRLLIDNFIIGYENKNTGITNAVFTLPIKKEKLTRISKDLLDKFEDKIDLHKTLDDFVYVISQKHIKNRELTKCYIDNAILKISDTKEKLTIKHDLQTNDFICVQDSKAEHSRGIELSLEWFELVKYLQKKHSYAVDYSTQRPQTYLNNKKPAR